MCSNLAPAIQADIAWVVFRFSTVDATNACVVDQIQRRVLGVLLLVYGFGTMVGPLFTAQMMDMVGPAGVFTTTTIAHGLFAAYALYRTFRREQVDEVERTDFRTLGLARTNTPESYALDPRSTPDNFVLQEEDELPPIPPPVKVELD